MTCSSYQSNDMGGRSTPYCYSIYQTLEGYISKDMSFRCQLTRKPVNIYNTHLKVNLQWTLISLYYFTSLLGVVLVRSAPTTFHIIDVDDFTSISYPISYFRKNLTI
jgi:hypothetical protein